MGLLDALFSPDSYGGQSGGLLDLIRSTQAQNGQYQPSTGLPAIQPPASFADRFSAMPGAPPAFNPAPRQMDASSFDPSTFAPNQAQPIQVGNNYQMTRIGDAGQYQPSQAALPPNAQPTQGVFPQQPQAQPQATPMGTDQGVGFGDRLNAGFQNFANAGGPLQALAGGISGLVSGQRTDPAGMLQQQYKATYDALKEAGMSPSTAYAAALSPKLLEQLAPAYLAKNDIVDGGTDPLTGKKTFVLKNTVDGSVKELNSRGGSAGGASAGSGQDVADSIAQAKAKGATREQLLQLVPSSYRPYVDAVLQDKALPANMGRGAARMQVMGLAHAVDGNFNEEMIPTRVAMRKDFAGEGKNGMAIGSFNTVQHHIGQVSDAVEGLVKAGGGGDFPLINAGKLMLANNTSLDPKLRDAAETLKNKLNAAQHEVANAYNAGHISDSDRKTWEEIKASNLPADQLRQKLADFEELLAGKRDSLNHIYRTTFGEDAPAIDRKANEEVSAKVHARLRNDAPTQSGGIAPGWTYKGSR